MGTAKASTKQHTIIHWRRMKPTLSLFVAFCVLLGIVSSHPQNKGYGEENQMAGMEVRTSCSIDDLLKCQEEINQAMSDCGHLDTLAEITTCINDILTGLPDCQKCVCDALPQLCGV